MEDLRLLIATVILLFIITPVSAEIVYSDQFYDNQNYTNQLVINPTIGSLSFATAIGIKNTNELLMKQNELLQEQNNLTITQNEILRRIYDVLIHSVGNMGHLPDPHLSTNYPPLDV
jgi:hypothetical protein